MFADIHLWVPLVIIVPLLGAMMAFVIPSRAFQVALIASFGTAGILLGMLSAFIDSGSVRHQIGGWGAPLGIDLVLDGLSMAMLLLTAMIGVTITIYAHAYFSPPTGQLATPDKTHQFTYFWALWLFLWASLNALFLSGDVFNLYVTLELLGFAAVSLTALSGKATVLKAAMRYLMVSLSGSLFYLMGVTLLYGNFGTLDIALLSTLTSNTPLLIASSALITAGLIMKTALFPLHFWLPPAHANATAPVSALLSALVVKGSFYILIRLWLDVFYPLEGTFIPELLVLLGASAIVWGSLQAIQQKRLKLLVAYSTVAQIGYLFLLMPILITQRDDSNALAAVVCFVFAHATAKAAAFLSAGNVERATGNDNIAELSGLTRALPVTAAAFGMAGISLVALPPSGGFIAKWLMLNSAVGQEYWGLVLVIIAGGLLAAVYIMRVLVRFFHEGDDAHQAHWTKVPTAMKWSTFALATMAIVLGFVGIYLLDILAIGTPWLLEGGV